MDPNASAFPLVLPIDGQERQTDYGLTMRAYIATKVLAGLLSAEQEGNVFDSLYQAGNYEDGSPRYVSGGYSGEKTLISTRHESAAKEAVKMADALIAELNK